MLFLLLTRLSFAQNITTVTNLELASTYESISIYASFSGDDNANNLASLEWRKVGDSTWKSGMSLTVDRRSTVQNSGTFDNTRFKNQWRGSILLVQPDTSYEVRVTFSDSDSIVGTNPVTATISTRKETNQINSIGNAYYVSTSGSDANPGTESQPFRTIQKAVDTVGAGDTIYVNAGTYSEAVTITKSGNPSNYITTEVLRFIT